MRKIVYASALCLATALLAGCVGGPKPVEVGDIIPRIYTLPTIKKSSLFAGVYFSPQFASAEHHRHMGPDTYVLPIGEASVFLFDHAFRLAFSRTSRVADVTPEALAAQGVDVAIAPTLVYFNIRHGFDGDGPSRRWSVAYRLTLYSRTGVPVASWIVTGDDPGGYWFDGAKQDLEAAGRAFLSDFRREAGPALAAIARNADGKAGSVDPSSAVLTARPTALQGIEPDAAAALVQAGMVPVRVSVQSASARKLVVRGSDTRLVLANGQSISPASLDAVLGALEDPSTSRLAWGFGGILGAVAAAQSQQDQRGQATSLMGNELLADRTLEKGEQASGVVLFHVPGGAQSARGATLRAWVVDPAAATGVQLDAPLSGAQGTVARTPKVATPMQTVEAKPTTDAKPRAAPKAMASASPSAVVRESAPPRSMPPAAGPGGLGEGNRWEYRYIDSRNGRTTSRRFEITRVDASTIVERIELENGKVLGMQYAPYYRAFQRDAVIGPTDSLRVESGDACATRRINANDYAASHECLVRAEPVGTETINVPAGTFQTQVVRVIVKSEAFGGHRGAQSSVVSDAKFWISPKAGRIVKAVVNYEADRPWTETMELASMTPATAETQRAQSPVLAAMRQPATATLAPPPDGVLLGDLLAMGAKKLSGAEVTATLTRGVLHGQSESGGMVAVSYKPDGSVTGTINGNDLADGKWRTEASGRTCVDFWIPRYRKSWKDVCRYWFKLGEALYVAVDSESDRSSGARMMKRTLSPR